MGRYSKHVRSGKTQDTLERPYILTGLRTPWNNPKKVRGDCRKRDLLKPCQLQNKQLNFNPSKSNSEKMFEEIDRVVSICWNCIKRRLKCLFYRCLRWWMETDNSTDGKQFLNPCFTTFVALQYVWKQKHNSCCTENANLCLQLINWIKGLLWPQFFYTFGFLMFYYWYSTIL